MSGIVAGVTARMGDPRARLYGDGFVAGIACTLRMILGDEMYGGEPYRGPYPRELVDFCERTLAIMVADGVADARRD